MHILSILFFAVASSSDNFIIGLSYGAKNIYINFINNLVVAFISCMGTFSAMLFAQLICRFIAPHYTNILGSLVLLLFGLYMLFNAFKKTNQDESHKHSHSPSKMHHYNEMIDEPELLDRNNSKTIEFKEALILGFVLCINNIGLGIGASISGFHICLTSLSSLIFSILFIKFGYHFGKVVSSGKLANYSEKLSALVIILLAIYELFI